MPHSYTHEAIVLKAYDVGEADRFLVLFTRERGRVAARARGVRKLKSRLGGHLLPFQHITIGLTESSAGFIVTSAQRKSQLHISPMKPFLRAEQGIEIILLLLHEEEPLPDVFELTLKFLNRCQKSVEDPVLTFTLKLLSLFGLLPDMKSREFAPSLSESERCYAQACLAGRWEGENLPPDSCRKLSAFCNRIIEEQSDRELRSMAIASLMK